MLTNHLPVNVDQGPAAEGGVTVQSALDHTLFLVDINKLYDVALGMYDFDLAVMVAEKSQKVCHLGTLWLWLGISLVLSADIKNCVLYAMYTVLGILFLIVRTLKSTCRYWMNWRSCLFITSATGLIAVWGDIQERWTTSANVCWFVLGNCVQTNLLEFCFLQTGDDRFDECLAFVREHSLYKQALAIFSNPQLHENRVICELYGNHLMERGKMKEAGIGEAVVCPGRWGE